MAKHAKPSKPVRQYRTKAGYLDDWSLKAGAEDRFAHGVMTWSPLLGQYVGRFFNTKTWEPLGNRIMMARNIMNGYAELAWGVKEG